MIQSYVLSEYEVESSAFSHCDKECMLGVPVFGDLNFKIVFY
jgi:hypothetical protein